MREKEAFTSVHSGDCRHIIFRKREVEHVHVLTHPLDTHRFGYHDHTSLNQIMQSDLCRTLTVFAADSLQHGIREQVVSSFGKRSP